jgi:four helix bundle protein
MPDDHFIPAHGGYESLLSYQKAVVVFVGTCFFVKKWLPRHGDRTVDQMVQAARSGKQNIVEGSMASGTSKEMEVKLTNVARASMEELKEDFRDFLKTRQLPQWDTKHPYTQRLRTLNRTLGADYETFKKGIESEDPEIAANVLLGLTTVTCYPCKSR